MREGGSSRQARERDEGTGSLKEREARRKCESEQRATNRSLDVTLPIRILYAHQIALLGKPRLVFTSLSDPFFNPNSIPLLQELTVKRFVQFNPHSTKQMQCLSVLSACLGPIAASIKPSNFPKRHCIRAREALGDHHGVHPFQQWLHV